MQSDANDRGQTDPSADGARRYTREEYENLHPQSVEAARETADEIRAKRVLDALMSTEHELPVADLADLLGEPVPEGYPQLHQLLRSRAGHLLANKLSPVEVVAELQRIAAVRLTARSTSISARYEPRTWLVENLIPAGMAGILNGPGDAGKSTLALQLAYELARPQGDSFDWAGFARPAEAGPCRTLIACYEDEPSEIGRRFYRINGLSEQLPAHVVEHVRVIERIRDMGPLWAADERDPRLPGGPTDAWYAVLDEAQEIKADLLILDPLAAIYLDNENDRGRVRRFMDGLNKWAEENTCTVLLLAHPSKSAGDATELSGVTDWRAAARFSLGLEPDPAPRDLRNWERAGADIPDLLRETAVLEPGKGNYAPRGAVRGQSLRLPADGRWQTIDRETVLAARADVIASAKDGSAGLRAKGPAKLKDTAPTAEAQAESHTQGALLNGRTGGRA